jgi:hypothetical protein
MDRTVPPEVTVAEDAGAAADVADKVLRPDNSRRCKAHSQGLQARRLPVPPPKLRCNRKVRVHNSPDRSTRGRNSAAAITVASSGASMVVPGSRSTEDMAVRTKKHRVHLVLLDQ